MAGYVFEHEGKQFDPNGKATVSDTAEHNKQLELAELAEWANKPAEWVGYVILSTAPKAGESYIVTTWLGTKIGEIDRYRDYRDGLGHRMRSVRVRGTNGAVYHGRYGYDWRQCVRLRRCK